MKRPDCVMGQVIGDPAPWLPPYYPRRETSAAPRAIHVVPSIQEQMGVDPISKLAAAIERLADAINGREMAK